MEKVEKTEVKEMPQAEQKVPENQLSRRFELKPNSRIELVGDELTFLINVSQAFMPFIHYANGITQIAAFGQYLTEKLIKSDQVIFKDQPEASNTLVEPLKQEETEEDKAASEELSKMRVVHKSETQEELANQ